MKVFKFGGASINSIDRFKDTAQIIKSHAKDKLLLVVSAMGKTTNALEKVAGSFFEAKSYVNSLDNFNDKISYRNPCLKG